jgi:dolichyl-phosphate beta-glucosyltransferase
VRPADIVLVVPCYNEERRLDSNAFVAFARSGRATLLFIDDGSTDGTAAVLQAIQEAVPERVRIVRLAENRGKAEAVRQGLQRGLESGARIVGYADADLSTPFSDLARLLDVTEGGTASVVLGSRVALLGASIERNPFRHYIGRVFATAASLTLDLPVYDTQCGAKCFRASAALRAAVDEPFLSIWAFDVELIGRLLVGTAGNPPLSVADLIEIPLRRWRDVGKSKVSTWGMAQAVIDLLRIRRDLGRRQRAQAGPR